MNRTEHNVRKTLVRHLYDHSAGAVVLTALVTLMLGSMLAFGPGDLASVSATTVYWWWGVTAVVLTYRALLAWGYFAHRRRQHRWTTWLNLYTVGAGLSGLCLGIGSMALVREASATADALILLVIAAMVVSAIPYLAVEKRSYNTYLLTSTVPLVVGLLLQYDSSNVVIAALVPVFSLGILSAATRFNELLRTSLTLRAQSERLSSKLQHANEQLASDLQRRKAITKELRQARQAAETANRAKSKFLSSMSHELRTPLNAILGFSELLSVLPAKDIERHRAGHLESIQTSGKHLLSLIDDVLDVAKLDSGEIELHPEPLRIADLVDECRSILDPQIRDRNLQFAFERTEAAETLVELDRLRLRQILLNLISNAVKYNRDGGTVTVDVAWNESGGISISVSDTGIGISDDDVDKIFRAFVRVGEDARRIQGTGIGLTITRQLTEYMGGRIGVTARQGGGSTFRIELPAEIRERRAS